MSENQTKKKKMRYLRPGRLHDRELYGKGHTVNFGSNKMKLARKIEKAKPREYPQPITTGPNKGTHTKV
jgi:hypothetical protein